MKSHTLLINKVKTKLTNSSWFATSPVLSKKFHTQGIPLFQGKSILLLTKEVHKLMIA